jgi:hypothetical protein
MQLNSMWSEEMEYRRLLFKTAAKGDARAQEELEREYHVRVRHENNPRHKKRRLPKTKKSG